MDLSLYLSVLRRHKRITTIGIALALAAAVLAYVKIGPAGISYRSSPIYESKSTLLVTQAGFPWGRSTLDQIVTDRGAVLPKYGDIGRMQYLATLYANLAESDEVTSQVWGGKKAPYGEKYTADAVRTIDGALPLVEIVAQATSKPRAIALANKASRGLQTYIQRRQAAEGVAKNSRVLLPAVESARKAEVAVPRRPTKSIMIFLFGVILTVGAAFLRENVVRSKHDAGLPVVGAAPRDSTVTTWKTDPAGEPTRVYPEPVAVPRADDGIDPSSELNVVGRWGPRGR